MTRIFMLGLALLFILIVGFFAFNQYIYNEKQADSVDVSISSFDECIDAGYPSLESYPEQCRTADGKHFARNLPEDELVNVISPIATQGTLICLVPWDTSVPQTLECSLGLMTGEGTYYVLEDTDPNYENIIGVPTGAEVEVDGMLIPGSHPYYRSIGTIEVERIISNQ